MIFKLFYRLFTFWTLICLAQVSQSQPLSLSECASNCTLQVTRQYSTCVDGINCFCNDPQLFELGQDCFQQNCTIREALTAQNMTYITCEFPERDRGPVSSAVTFTSMSVALVLVAMRIIAFAPNLSLLWWWDDVLVGLATILMIGNAVCNPISRHYGYGRDVWLLPFDNTSQVEKIFYIGGVIYAVGVASTKVAFLFFYLKLFPSKLLRRIAWPLIIVTCCQGIAFTVLFIFQCNPISYAWLQWDGTAQGTCLNFGLGAVLHAGTNILLDLLIFALPISQLWKLNLSRKKKLQVMSMFAVGFFVTLVSILRLYSMVQLGNSNNPTWDYVPFGYWSDLEFNIGIACICMPSLRIVLRRYFPGCGFGSTEEDYNVDGDAATANRKVDLTKGLNSLTQRYSVRPTTSDRESDSVELVYQGTTDIK